MIDENDNEDPPMDLIASSTSYESELTIPFILGRKEAAATVASYAKLEFAFFTLCSILVIVLVHR